MKFKKLIACLFGCIFLTSVNSQQFIFSEEIRFAKHLVGQELYQEAANVLFTIDSFHLTRTQKDSLFYEIGWLSYSTKKLDTAIFFLDKVSVIDSRFNKATFFSAYCKAYLKQFSESENTLSKADTTTTEIVHLKKFELAAIALLKKDELLFKHLQEHFTYDNFFLKQEQENLKRYSSKLFHQKKKSAFIAGALSTVLPGAGKWYAGKKKQAIGSFLPILSSAILTIEAYNKGGIKDARTWIYGTLFSTFYIGNIWGSVVAVKINKKEYRQLYENKILFDMHIPLRNFFN